MRTAFVHRFVDMVPEKLEEGVLYVAVEYCTVVHKCFCGCGKEVATPISPTDWQLTFDGDSVSLAPSIGNWSYPCRSHYLLRGNRIQWCADMPQSLINAGRARDRQLKTAYYASRPMDQGDPPEVMRQPPAAHQNAQTPAPRQRLMASFWAWLTGAERR